MKGVKCNVIEEKGEASSVLLLQSSGVESPEVMMNSTIQCFHCKQQVPVAARGRATFVCPACKYENRIPTLDRPSSREQGKFSLVPSLAVKLKNRAHKPVSLNFKPSSSAAATSVARLTKRALLIGVSYKDPKQQLKGTVNDVKNMRDWLVYNCGFSRQSIRVLTEEEPEPELHPTKKIIKNSLAWLVEGCQYGDSLVFYFSGHGLREPDLSDDEHDGFNETILPVDFMEAGMINDNEIYDTIVRPLPNGVTLHAFVDACHSGTVLDIPFVYNIKRKEWEDFSLPNVPKKQTNGGLAISISACQDDELAADTSAFAGPTMSGALTYVLIDIAKRNPDITYGELVESIHQRFEKSNQEGCLAKRILKRVLNDMILQKPQLSASETFDVNKKKFAL